MTNAALLVMDVQPGIIGRIDDPDALVERLRGAITTARAAGAAVAFVRVGFTDEEAAAVPERNKMFTRLGSGPGNADDAASQVDPRLGVEEGDIVVRKRRVGAFSTTDLHEQLQAKGIDTLVLGGISTGQDLDVSVAIKPTSSILIPRDSIDVAGAPTEVITKGRHDPCVGIRAAPIMEALLALVVMDHALRHRAQCGDVEVTTPDIAAAGRA